MRSVARGRKPPFDPRKLEEVSSEVAAGVMQRFLPGVSKALGLKKTKTQTGVAGLAVKGVREVLRDLPSPQKDLSRILKVGGLEKKAIDPITALLAGTGFHVASNIGVKALKRPGKLLKKVPGVERASKAMASQRESQLAKGVREGLSGTPRPTSSKTIEMGTVPELFINRPIGEAAGKELRQLSRGKQYRALKKLRKEVASTPGLRKTPVFEDMVGGINKLLDPKAPKLPKAKKAPDFDYASRASKIWEETVKPALPLAAAAAIKPSAGVHAGTNLTRLRIGQSELGKKYVKQQATLGALDKRLPHMRQSKTKKTLTDVFLSPAARDPRKISRDLMDLAEKDPRRLARLAGSLGSFPEVRKSVREVVQNARGLAPDIRERILRSLGQAP